MMDGGGFGGQRRAKERATSKTTSRCVGCYRYLAKYLLHTVIIVTRALYEEAASLSQPDRYRVSGACPVRRRTD